MSFGVISRHAEDRMKWAGTYDDNWQENYGNWEFSAVRFRNPKAMMGRLHRQGFQVMLWICPFVSPDSAIFRDLADRGLLLLDKELTPTVKWGNNQNNAAIIRLLVARRPAPEVHGVVSG